MLIKKATELRDGLVNFAANLGVGGRDKSVATHYTTPIFNHVQLSQLYRSSWSARRVVDIPAGDMVREWRTWTDNNDEFIVEERKFGLQRMIRESIISGKKYGGAGVYIGVGDEDLELELDPESVSQGGLEMLVALDRHELTPVEFEMDPLSDRYRRGKIYSINRGSGGDLRIHHSRFAWFHGNPISNFDREVNQGWDDSIFVGLESLIKNADTAIHSLGHLILESKIDVIGIKDLANYFTNAESEDRLRKRLIASNYMKSSINALLIDSEDSYESKHNSLTGVADIAMKSLETLAGAADIPITRFLGKSPGGLNSTGESDIRNYYDGISSLQETSLTPSLRMLDEVFVRHVTGKSLDDIPYSWDSLWQMSKKEKTDISKTQAETAKIHNDMGLLSQDFIAGALLNQMKEDDTYPGIEQLEEELGDVIEVFSEEDVENERNELSGLEGEEEEEGGTSDPGSQGGGSPDEDDPDDDPEGSEK